MIIKGSWKRTVTSRTARRAVAQDLPSLTAGRVNKSFHLRLALR
jgi:hypothetical protein